MDPLQALKEKLEGAKLWSKTTVIARNDFLKRKGSTDTNIYYIVDGSMRIYLLDEGEEQVIRFGYKDNLIAALDSFISGQPSDLYIQAIKKTSIKSISKVDFMNFIESSSENTHLWHEVLGAFILQQMERERDLLTSSPIKRYNQILERSPQVFQEIPHKYIASYLRMTPETLSRIKKS